MPRSDATDNPTSGLIARCLLLMLRAYRFLLSPWIGNQCRFFPSCSCYAEEAITKHGALRGSLLTVRRLSRCHPWHPGGVDLVPPSYHDKQ